MNNKDYTPTVKDLVNFIESNKQYWDERWNLIKPDTNSNKDLTAEQLIVKSKMEEWHKFPSIEV